jgi:hypothetical protein
MKKVSMSNAAGSVVSMLRATSRVVGVSAGALVLLGAGAALAQPGSSPPPVENSSGLPAGTAPAGEVVVEEPVATESSPVVRWVGMETEFVSATEMPWEVMVDQQSACWTPCKLVLDGPHWVTMRSRDRRPIRLEVGELGRAPAAVTAHDLKTGTYATGITFTALGGSAVITGITLTAVGCSQDRDGMCKAGLISGGAGALVTLGGIWLMRSALPRYQIRALERHGLSLFTSGNGGGVVGRF